MILVNFEAKWSNSRNFEGWFYSEKSTTFCFKDVKRSLINGAKTFFDSCYLNNISRWWWSSTNIDSICITWKLVWNVSKVSISVELQSSIIFVIPYQNISYKRLEWLLNLSSFHLRAASDRTLWATCAKTAAFTWLAASLRSGRCTSLNEASFTFGSYKMQHCLT